tara:strand:- start:565 stop:693 length:129 start_codon:yes stop_codon:yes gene_type:complete
MNSKSEYLVGSIFKKLKNYRSKEIFLKEENFKEFIISLFSEK